MRIGVISLGCSKNLINTEQMMFLLADAGFEVTGELENAKLDVILLNTCGFIESAKSEAIENIIKLGEMKRKGQFRKLVVAGCLIERYKNSVINELPEIDAVIGTGAFDEIVSVIKGLSHLDINEQVDFCRNNLNFDYVKRENCKEELEDNKKIAVFGDIHAPVSEAKRIITTSPTWAYLKIAEGCDNNCAYCVIPSIRGRFRSRRMEDILNEVRELVSKGIRELIIVAQDVTKYGVDLYKKHMLVSLLEALCDIEGLRWVRLHYLYPHEIDENLIDFISSHDKILKYLDIPIQHINDDILAKMNRKGTGEDIRNLFRRLRDRIPGVVLRTSIITGLPGEGEKEFAELFNFIKETKIERAGIFQYSPEEGSVAAEMDYPDAEIAAKRAEMLTDLQMRVMDEYDLTRIGDMETILIEGQDLDGRYYGRSFAESPDVDGYITVEGSGIALHDFIKINITDASEGTVIGKKFS